MGNYERRDSSVDGNGTKEVTFATALEAAPKELVEHVRFTTIIIIVHSKWAALSSSQAGLVPIEIKDLRFS